ncbi:MAG: calcium-binding EGF-like domain-containing protein [Archangium sp.]
MAPNIRSILVVTALSLAGCRCSDPAVGEDAGVDSGTRDAGTTSDAGTDGGASCSAATTCNGHGTCNATGGCDCASGFAGASCNTCATDFFGFPACTFCSAATTCGGHGTCNASGGCDCASGFAGAGCNTCAADHFNFPLCTPCTAATTCGGHGSCNATGACDCSSGFAGASCNACATDFFAFPACTFCSAATTCSGHGTCNATGACDCASGFADAGCGQCAVDHFNFPACTFCSAATTCNGHGTCATDGACACSTGFGDAGCDECAPGFTGYPACALPLMQPLSASTFRHSGPLGPDVFFGNDGGVYVARTHPNEVYVSQLVNSAWEDIGAMVSDAGVIASMSKVNIVVTAEGPLVAYGQLVPGVGVAVMTRQFDGTAWVERPFSNVVTTGSARAFELLVDSQGRAVMVAIQSGSLVVKRLEGGQWVALGSSFRTQLSTLVAALRPDDSVVVATTEPAGFGTLAFVSEQEPLNGTWTSLGQVDAIGDTTQSLDVDDIDVSATETVLTWNRGTCNTFPMFTASPPAWTPFTLPGDVGAEPTSVLDGPGLVQASRPTCAGAMRTIRRWNGTTWSAPLDLDFMNSATLEKHGGSLFIVYVFGNTSQGNVLRLNVP